MNGPIASAIAVAFIVACLCTTVVICVAILRGSGATRRLRRKAIGTPASSISADEVIDVHLALKDLKSLRELAEEVVA